MNSSITQSAEPISAHDLADKVLEGYRAMKLFEVPGWTRRDKFTGVIYGLDETGFNKILQKEALVASYYHLLNQKSSSYKERTLSEVLDEIKTNDYACEIYFGSSDAIQRTLKEHGTFIEEDGVKYFRIDDKKLVVF